MGEALGGWQIQILIGVTNSLFLIIIGEEETQILISIGWRSRFLLSMRTLISSPSYTRFMKQRSSSIWLTSLRRSMSSSWLTNLREERPHGGTNFRPRGEANHPWWHGGAWSNSYKVDSFHPIINKSCTINLNNADKVKRTVVAYIKEFYRHSSRWELSMTDEQQTAKYISGLKYPI